MALELDLDDDFDAVLARAARNFPALQDHLARLVPAPRCHRALAANRLHVRRWAARRQRPGESWSTLDTRDLVDDELRRMNVMGEEARGCRRASCTACNPPACSCSGGSCSTSA